MHIIFPCLNLLSFFLKKTQQKNFFTFFFAKERNLKSKWMGIVELFLYQRYGIFIAQCARKRCWSAVPSPFL